MSFTARAYIFVILATGSAAILTGGLDFHPADPFRFVAYLVLAMVASSLKVAIPGATGTMSVVFLFLLIGIIDLTLAEALAMGVASAFVQSFWRTKQRARLLHVSFNIASVVIAVSAAQLVYTAPVLLEAQAPIPVRLAAATLTFFFSNTLAVSIVIALTENKPVVGTWRNCYFWSLPYYIVGGCLAGLFSFLTQKVGWQTSILFLPIVYLMYRSYHLYLERLEQSRIHAEELQAAANRLNAVLEGTTDLVLATDAEGKITYVNQRARTRLFGERDPVGAVLWDMFPELARAGFPQQVRKALESRSPVSLEEEFFPECNAFFDVHAYPSPEGLALYLKDVTEERGLAEQLRQAQKMEAVGRLAGGIAHDFNNLLTIILGYGQVMADTVEADSPAQTAATEILKAGDRAAALTHRLLAFSRKQVMQPVIVDLNSVVTGLESMLRRLIGEDIRTTVQLDPSVGKVKADPNQIEQVVMNLAINARDAMPNGGELAIRTCPLQLEALQAKHHRVMPGRYAVISVSDNGVGMDAATKARVFEPFFTTKEMGKGTGLGLSTVYGIIQQSGGYVTVQSEPRRGATFNIHLPSVSDSAEPVRTTEAEVSEVRTGKVLLLEDEDSLRDLMHRMLTDAGYTVSSFAGAAEALDLSAPELKSFDVLVTDIVMPGMNGHDLAEELVRRHQHLKLLFVCGYTEHPLVGTDLLSKDNRILTKPFTRSQLLSKLHSVLEGRLLPEGG